MKKPKIYPVLISGNPSKTKYHSYCPQCKGRLVTDKPEPKKCDICIFGEEEAKSRAIDRLPNLEI